MTFVQTEAGMGGFALAPLVILLPVAGLPMQALDRGAHLVIVNHSPTYLGVRADAVLEGDVAEILPAIAEGVLHG